MTYLIWLTKTCETPFADADSSIIIKHRHVNTTRGSTPND